MANSRYQRGAALERQWVADRRSDGYVAARTPGSKGSFDALAARPGDLILAQMKCGGTSVYSGFGPSSRQQLALEAARAGGRAILVRKLHRQRGYTTYPEDEWPDG